MALAVTSLNGGITQNAVLVTLTAFTNPSTGGIGPRTILVVDGEHMLVTDTTLAPTLQVARGVDGTVANAHNTLAPVVYGLTTLFGQTVGPQALPVSSISVSGTFVNPTVDQTVYINKAGVCAITLTDPTADSVVTVKFISLTANAHTITYATGFYDNTTTSDVATFAATAGATLTIQAIGGKWRPIATADDGVTIG
jgi:hypothetical protein